MAKTGWESKEYWYASNPSLLRFITTKVDKIDRTKFVTNVAIAPQFSEAPN
jgi:hypothetical protein